MQACMSYVNLLLRHGNDQEQIEQIVANGVALALWNDIPSREHGQEKEKGSKA